MTIDINARDLDAVSDRFWAKVDLQSEGCWNWLASKNRKGYGRFSVGRQYITASRMSWFLYHNELLPPEVQVCHKCDNPACVRPSHLFAASNFVNQRDMCNKKRQAKGGAIGIAKLDDLRVMAIRQARADGQTCTVLAKAYGVTISTIWMICLGLTWTHLPVLYSPPPRSRGRVPSHEEAVEMRTLYKAGERTVEALMQQYRLSRRRVNEVLITSLHCPLPQPG